jgi:hypothetical protein
MGFASGSVSFRRFNVVGKAPKAPDQKHLDALEAHALKPSEFGVPEEEEWGWSGGRHVFDATFSFEHNVYADAIHFALRIDTNKVPGELKKAYELMEQDAAAKDNPSGFVSKTQKKDVKETIRAKMEDELRTGKFRRSKLLPVLWDFASQTVYCSASGAAFEKLGEIFERTFNLKLEPVTAGSLGARLLGAKSKKRDYEDLKATRFVHGPEGENQVPDYPWAAKGPEPKDFLGNEFLVWLWYEADARTAIIATESVGDVTVYFDKALELDCSYGQTGKDSFKGDGPSRMPEAMDGLRSGKVPRKAGLILDANKQQYWLNLSAEPLAVGAGKLPDVEEADSDRVLFEERIELLRELTKAIDALFDTFLNLRASSAWESHVGKIRRWILKVEQVTVAA